MFVKHFFNKLGMVEACQLPSGRISRALMPLTYWRVLFRYLPRLFMLAQGRCALFITACSYLLPHFLYLLYTIFYYLSRSFFLKVFGTVGCWPVFLFTFYIYYSTLLRVCQVFFLRFFELFSALRSVIFPYLVYTL